jgi:hypothetical protein
MPIRELVAAVRKLESEVKLNAWVWRLARVAGVELGFE